MDLIIAGLFKAIFLMGLPVAGLSFIMVWWALQRGVLDESGDLKSLQAEIDALAQQQKGKKKDDAGGKVKPQKLNPLHEKWFKFGGGFYGITALYTWLLVEWSEVKDLVGGLGDLVFRLDIGILITFFIESFMNFITAITWPLYWMSESSAGQIWIWFLVAYGAYGVGVFAAQKAAGKAWGDFGFKLFDDSEDDT